MMNKKMKVGEIYFVERRKNSFVVNTLLRDPLQNSRRAEKLYLMGAEIKKETLMFRVRNQFTLIQGCCITLKEMTRQHKKLKLIQGEILYVSLSSSLIWMRQQDHWKPLLVVRMCLTWVWTLSWLLKPWKPCFMERVLPIMMPMMVSWVNAPMIEVRPRGKTVQDNAPMIEVTMLDLPQEIPRNQRSLV
uniref:Uncharacterized protein LOC8262372 isoform X3 n=1 Tax=Rhizophora mucronata TaxID=61149 RepID=A0A2P2NGY9_RHIMU